jgi:hypothetical protein
MDEGVTSNAQASSSTSVVGQTDLISTQRGAVKEAGDETMSDISGTKRMQYHLLLSIEN